MAKIDDILKDAPDVWKTKSSFFNWLRGALRRAWSKHLIKIEFIRNNRIFVQSKKIANKLVYGLKCNICRKDYPQSEIQIDHITPAGSLLSTDDLCSFVGRLLLVSFDDLQAVCKGCHDILSYSQKHGISFEESIIRKRVIEITKNNNKCKEFLKKHGIECKNAKERKKRVEEIIRDDVGNKYSNAR